MLGQSVTFTAVVSVISPGGGTPTGSVDFFDTTSNTVLGSAALKVVNGTVVATLTTSILPIGIQTITATYNGTGNFKGSSSSLTQTVAGADYILNRTSSGALSLSGNAVLETSGIVYVDSSSASAVQASGNAQVDATILDVAGGDKVTGNAARHAQVITGAASIADPLAGLAALTSSLTKGVSINLSGNNSMTINPGTYSQINVSGNAKLTLNPGIYIIAGGGITVSGNAAVTGSGVLIYNAGSNVLGSGNTFGGITISGNAVVSLTASTTGAYAGIAIFQSRDNTSAITVSGNADLNLNDGVLYAAAAIVTDSGNSELNASLIVNTLQLSGNALVC